MNKCIDCDKIISRRNIKCQSCSHKGQIHSLEARKKISKKLIGIKRTEETKKKMSETRIKLGLSKGKNNFFWKNGMSRIPYSLEWTEQLKKQIRKRDNYECQNCNITEEEHLIVIGTNLQIHHIDYNKENCQKDNLITLCKQCNLRANSNRNYWTDYFQEKIIKILTKNGGIPHGSL
jgi:5-methylcytosine-specific restriction endonuclease McrA